MTTFEVVDGEVVDTEPAVPGVRATRLPYRQAGRFLAALGKFLSCTVPGDVWRGMCAWVRMWWRWKTLAKLEEKAEELGKAISTDPNKIQEALDARTRRSIALAFLLAGAIALAWWLAPVEYWFYVASVLVLALWASGHQWRAPLDGPPADERPPGYDESDPLESVRRAFLGAGLTKAATKTQRGKSVWFASGTKPERVGVGVQLVLDLDSGDTWRHVLTRKDEVASGLGVDADFMVVEKGDHSGQVQLWFSEDDPYRHGNVRSPLMRADRWSAWESAPFGQTPHGHEIPLTLMYSNMLLGGSPGSGKGWTSRNVAAPFVLDPDARLFIANGKSSGDWKPLRNICGDYYISGTTAQAMQRVSDMLDVIIEEMLRRNLYTEKHGVSKIVPKDGFAPWLVLFDEVHRHCGCNIPSGIKRGRKELTWGEVVTEKLITLVKESRSSAIVMVLLTQKPGAKSIPTDLRDPIGTRFACRVGNSTTSEQVLGLTCKDGVDASKLPAKHRGIGILVPDAELGDQVTGYPTLRPYTIDDADWERLGERGYVLRREAGTHGYLRLSEGDAEPLPEQLEQIMDIVRDMRDDERVSSRMLREHLGIEDEDETAFGWQLRKWGAPTSRAKGNKGPKGPMVGDLRIAAQRIREGGPEEVQTLRSA